MGHCYLAFSWSNLDLALTEKSAKFLVINENLSHIWFVFAVPTGNGAINSSSRLASIDTDLGGGSSKRGADQPRILSPPSMNRISLSGSSSHVVASTTITNLDTASQQKFKLVILSFLKRPSSPKKGQKCILHFYYSRVSKSLSFLLPAFTPRSWTVVAKIFCTFCTFRRTLIPPSQIWGDRQVELTHLTRKWGDRSARQ